LGKKIYEGWRGGWIEKAALVLLDFRVQFGVGTMKISAAFLALSHGGAKILHQFCRQSQGQGKGGEVEARPGTIVVPADASPWISS
jgi:hypothetical protein